MCTGIPMRIVEQGPGWARAETRDAGGAPEEVNTLLVGDPGAGTWVLVHLGIAREVLTEEAAHRTADALEAVEAALRGEPVDHLFPDLTGREPTLPPHLRGTSPEESQ
jgi:hydrogenase expression/formation protein HypC